MPNRILYGVLAALALVIGGGTCRAQAPAAISQRQINEQAAVLERVRRTLVDDSGLRRPGEPLNGFLARLCTALPRETPTTYGERVGRSVDLIRLAAETTVAVRRMPALRYRSEANRQTWERTTRALGFLPKRVVTLRAAWLAVEKAQTGAARASAVKRMAAELSETMHLVITGLDGLRDARP